MWMAAGKDGLKRHKDEKKKNKTQQL